VILFLDSSAVVKLYIEEADSKNVTDAVEKAQQVVVSTLTLAEVTHAISRREREGNITSEVSVEAYRYLLEDWSSFLRIAVDEDVAREASLMCRTRTLKGADAIQLASAALLSKAIKDVKFLSYDKQLVNIAGTYPGINIYDE
jgi:uncharacterized protein